MLGLVLDRIKKFMDKWGAAAQTEMWKEEHEAEVGAFYRCTCDYRALTMKSQSDVFPLPRIDYLLDQIPRGRCRFFVGDIQDAFWTVKLAECCWKNTAIRTHDQHLQSTVLPLEGGSELLGTGGVQDFCRRSSGSGGDIYQDDALVHSWEFEEHYQTLRTVYGCLRDRALTFKLTTTHLIYRVLRS